MSRDQKKLAKLLNDILQIIRILNNFPIGRIMRSKELAKLSTDIPQIIQILNNFQIERVKRSKEFAKLSNDIPQIIGILNNFPVDSQLTKFQRRDTNEDASRDQKELAMEITSKKLCRCVWLMTSVD
jgi:hypothetical protein